MVYTGPRNALVSASSDCVYATDVQENNLIFSPVQACKPGGLPEEKFYTQGVCQAWKEGNEASFVQVKLFHGQLHVYCPLSTLTMGKVTQPCPNETFILPVTAEFYINKQLIRGREFQIDHTEMVDPLFITKVNMYLQPKVPSDQLIEDVDMEAVVYSKNEQSKTHIFIITIISLTCVIVVVLLMSIACCMWLKREKINRNQVDEPLVEVVPVRTNDIIIEQ